MRDDRECPYSDLGIEKLKLLDEKTLEKTGNLVIPDLFKSNQHDMIIQIAGLGGIKYSNEATTAIIAIMSWMVRGNLYAYKPDVIEILPSVIATHSEEGEHYWTEELQKTLRNEKNLKKIDTWLAKRNSILKLAEVFNQQELIRDLLGRAIEEDEKLDEIEFWFDESFEIEKLIKTFGFEEEIRKRAEKAIKENNNISYWSERLSSVQYMVENLGLSDEKVKSLLAGLIRENTEKLIDITNLTTEDAIKKAIGNLIEGDTKDIRNFMEDCLKVAKKMCPSVYDPAGTYRIIADRLLKRANECKNDHLRWIMVVMSCRAYKEIKEGEKILKKYEKYNLYDDRGNKKGVDDVIKEASKIIKFKYRKNT